MLPVCCRGQKILSDFLGLALRVVVELPLLGLGTEPRSFGIE